MSRQTKRVLFTAFAALTTAGLMGWFFLESRSDERLLRSTLSLTSRDAVLRAHFDADARARLRDSLLAGGEDAGLSEVELHDRLATIAREDPELGGIAFGILDVYDPARLQRIFLDEAKRVGANSPGLGWATKVAAVTFASAEDAKAVIEAARSYLGSPSASLRFAGHYLLIMLSLELRAPNPWGAGVSVEPEEILHRLDPAIWQDLDPELATRRDWRKLVVRGLRPKSSLPTGTTEAPRRINFGILELSGLWQPREEAAEEIPDRESVRDALAPIPFRELQRLWSASLMF